MSNLTLRLFIVALVCVGCTRAALSSAQISPETRNGSLESEEDDEPVISGSYVLPNQIFNDGKPYYASKDPISGQLDFNAKKPAGIEPTANEVVNPNEKVILTSSSPNIHDFLNLPVKYSSSKFVYPLVSSSYANLKYQGSNKNFITNKKPTQVAQVTSLPNDQTVNHFTVPTTKLKPVPATMISSANNNSNKPLNNAMKNPINSSAAKPLNVKSTNSSSSINAPAKRPTSSSTKHIITTKKPQLSSYYTTAPAEFKTTTTRRKFIPVKKYSTTTTTTAATSTIIPEQKPTSTTVTSPKPTTTSNSRLVVTPSADIFLTQSPSSTLTYFTTTTTTTAKPSTNSKPILFTEDPNTPPAFSPIPQGTRITQLDPADIYYTVEQKNTENNFVQKPSMTLADIFNNLADEESALLANNPSDQGFDAQGNLMGPLSPSKPAPFTMHEAVESNKPTYAPTTSFPTFANTLKASSLQNSQLGPVTNNNNSFSNEYVSYQVQQPNIMQYRPLPAAINNVVISPGQQSASFVLGSQQQVGTNAFGSVKKETPYAKNPPVQYGTVINEDISTLKREPSPAAVPPSYQDMSISSQNSNYYQSDVYTGGESVTKSHLMNNNNPEPPPIPPSPYQQLPLVGSNNRKKPALKPLSPSEKLPSMGVMQSVNPLDNSDSITLGSNQNTQELLVSTNIRFPAMDGHVDEVPSVPTGGPPSGFQINGHAQPLSLQQIQSSSPVVFPKTDTETKLQLNEMDYHTSQTMADDIQIQKHEVLTMNQHQQKLSFPTATERNTPAQHMIPPPRFPPPISNNISEKPHQPHGPGQYTYSDYTRKPVPGITRPNPDRHLPNILPQFRPNAKVSSGHTPNTFNKEPGNIRVTGPIPPKRMLSPGNPQFSRRRQPLRYPINRGIDFAAGPPLLTPNDNRRIYRLSPYGHMDRMPPRRPVSHNLRPMEHYNIERHALAPALEKLPAFEEEDLVINDPPVTPSKELHNLNEAKLEPVVTLQMLQSHSKPFLLPAVDNSGKPELHGSSLDSINEDMPDNLSQSSNNVYVVLPLKGVDNSYNQINPLEISENNNALSTLAHIETSTTSEYQNTPFSVLSDRQQEPVLKNKKPQSLQQENKLKSNTNNDLFPYPIEKPEINLVEPSESFISPKIVNSAYNSRTEAPIALAYTPTVSSERIKTKYPTVPYSDFNLATPVIKEIRPNTKTEQPLSSHDFDLRAQNYEKNFMAPFYPSLSLGLATRVPSSDWNILTSSIEHNLYEKNRIDRSDNVKNLSTNAGGVENSKTFEIDKFQPELQGGFKPIYPPGYKFDSEENELKNLREHEVNKMPLALASRMEKPTKIVSESTLSSANNTVKSITNSTDFEQEKLKMSNKTTVAPVISSTQKTKKAKLETSLAALLFGDAEDEHDVEEQPAQEYQARQEPTKAMLSGPRSIPRMGPRSLSI